MGSYVQPSSPTNLPPQQPSNGERYQTDQYANPFHLHHNDHAGLILVSDRLSTASDFPAWRRSIWMALNVRNKLGFIDGSMVKPPIDHRDYGAWSRCNDVVATWLINSVDKKIGQSLLFISTAEGIWKNLLTRFKQDDAPRVFDIEQRLSKLEQGSMDISAYYTALLTLWEEHKNYVELPVCSCGKCECDAAVKWEKLQQRSRVTKFLMGLNEGYEQTRRHILMLKPIPTIEEAFNIVTQDERQKSIRPTTRVDSVAFQATAPVIETADYGYIAAYNTGRPIQKPICTNCGKTGHTVQRCFKIHGYPPGYKTNAPYRNNGQLQVQPRMQTSQFQPRMPQQPMQPMIAQMQLTSPMQLVPYANTIQNANAYASAHGNANQSMFGSYMPLQPQVTTGGNNVNLQDLTPEQIQSLVSQFNASVTIQEPEVPSPSASGPVASITEHGLMAQTSTSDSGASSHVCSDLAMFRDLIPVSGVTVTLPNGTRVSITHTGTFSGLDDWEGPESPSYDGKRSSLDDCTRPNDIAGPHYRSTCTIQSLQRLKELCRLPPDVMAESKMADPTESPEDHRDGYFCVYEIYFKGCGLTFPLPEALVRYLAALEISLPQLTPNLLRTILGIITVAAEAGYIIGVPELNELLSVRSSSKKAGYFSAYPNANRNIISHLPNKDENWHHPWFLIKKTPASIGNLSDVLPSKWSAKPAFVAPTLPTEDFVRFFKILLEGETLWNSFTLDRFIEANRKLRMSPPGQLQRLPPPPPSQGMSARALAAQRKKLSTPITKACDENKALLAAAIDKKDYSRSLLVDDGTAEGARSTGAYRLTPRRERHSDRSPRRARSPRHDSSRPPRDDFSNEPLKNLIRRKRDKSSRSDSSPQREKSRARTEHSPRSSPPAGPMGPPPPVDMSSQHSGEKTARNISPQKESSESQDAPPKSRPALVPQIKSLTAMEKEGSVFRCFKTRSGLILPEFDKWRPAIRERYLLHAHHSSRANSELNDMIEHYEGLLLSQQQEIELWRGKFTTLESDLQSSSGSKQQLEDQVDGLKSELEKIKGDLKDQYDQNYQLQNELSGVQGRLHESESSADALNNQLIELRAKYNAITKLRDSELARSASKARKEVKGRGMELIQGAIRFIQTEKVKSDLESDIKEHESNLILLDQIHDDDFSEVKERSELASSLSEKKNRLAALPASSFNPQDFAEFFTESPPLSESGLDWAGSSETEGIVSSEVPAAPKVTSGDVCTEGNEQGISSDQVPAKEVGENPTTEVEVEVPADPYPLFLSGDGFEPAGVLFPHAVFHFPSREKKEAYDFMDKVVDKHRRLCDERQRLGLKRQTLEARIARVERKVRALESDPFQWEWRNFDCIAEIPRMLRMYLRAKGQVQGPVNAPTEAALVDSEEEDEENDDNPWERVPNEPEVEGGNGASTSNSTSAMREPVPEPLP
ncbi:hypothetical protein ISN44_As10g026850 [Arabidopsis suecica]|uniref:CCHC-type domain-containing protein n=1 Tax=Arabidopsis suecica TaxID=45249 RepID=A0A8T1ZYP8_ARASU|nr:hypothetical protein ISN44_As10g026850 [Arabidopsis suecica]